MIVNFDSFKTLQLYCSKLISNTKEKRLKETNIVILVQ
jgi:hypothetical protein